MELFEELRMTTEMTEGICQICIDREVVDKVSNNKDFTEGQTP